MPKEKLKKLYGNLVNDGYELPEYSVFEADMADSAKRSKLHGNLVADGYELPDANTFTVDMGYGEPEKKNSVGASEFSNGILPAQEDKTDDFNSIIDKKQSLIGDELFGQIEQARGIVTNPESTFNIGTGEMATPEDLKEHSEDANNSLKNFGLFAAKLKGQLSEDGKTFVDENNNPITEFEEGAIVRVPKDQKLDDNQTHTTGFVQRVNNSWRDVSPFDPLFTAKSSEMDNVTVLGYRKKTGGKILTTMTGEQYNEHDDYNALVDTYRKKDEDITDNEYVDAVSKITTDENDPLYEALHTNRIAEGARKLPVMLALNPEIVPNYRQELKDHPSYNSTSQGAETVLNKAIVKTYELDKPIWQPKDTNSMVDAVKFKKMSDILADPELKKLDGTLSVLAAAYESETDPVKKTAIAKNHNAILETKKSKSAGQKEAIEYFKQPEVKMIMDRMDLQYKGASIISSAQKMLPQRAANEEKAFQKQHEELDAWQKITAPVKSLIYGVKNSLTESIAFLDETIKATSGATDVEQRRNQRENITNKERRAANEYIKRYEDEGFGYIANWVNDLFTMTGDVGGKMIGAAATGGAGSLAAKALTAMAFGTQSAQERLEQYRAEGIDEDTSNRAALLSGGMMAIIALGFPTGGKSLEGFKPSFNAIQKLLAGESKEGAKALSREIMEFKGGDLVRALGHSTKSAAELKLAELINAANNDLVNRVHGTGLSTDTGSIGEFLSTSLSFFAMGQGMKVFSKGKFTEEKKAALVMQAATGNMKESMDLINRLKENPEANHEALDEMTKTLQDFAGLRFAKDITPEQKTAVYLEVEKRNAIQGAIDASSPELAGAYKESLKEVNDNISRLMTTPTEVKKVITEMVKPVQEEIKEAVENPLDVPRETESSEVIESSYIEPESVPKPEVKAEPVEPVIEPTEKSIEAKQESVVEESAPVENQPTKGKPEINLEFIGAKELVSSKNRIQNTIAHKSIKSRLKILKKLMECL